MDDIIALLRKFGLSEKEAGAYLSLLELGEAGANDIALKGNLPRTLTYDLLERLIARGLVSYTIKGRKKEFMAADPHEFFRILKEKEEAVKTAIPTLLKLQAMKGIARPKAEVYEGNEGMMAVMNDILRSGVHEFLAYGSSRSSFEVIPAFMEDWHKERIQKKIVMKILYNDTTEARQKIQSREASLKFSEYKLMPIKLESPTATVIFGNKVVLQSWTKDPFAVMIENEDMAKNHKQYFEEMWKNAKLR